MSSARLAVFVLGCHRSGTTLVRHLLDSHPNVACGPETKLLGGFDACIRYPQVEAAMGAFGLRRKWLVDQLASVYEHMMVEWTDAQHKTQWVDKTPNYWRLTPLIDEMFGARARYVIVARHPFDTAMSLEASPYFKPDTVEDPDIAAVFAFRGSGLPAWCQYWSDVYRSMLQWRDLKPQQAVIVRYEDLVQKPDDVMASVFALLGVTAHRVTANGRFLNAPRRGGYGDWKIKHTSQVHSDRVGAASCWPDELRMKLWPLVDPSATALGYGSKEQDWFVPLGDRGESQEGGAHGP